MYLTLVVDLIYVIATITTRGRYINSTQICGGVDEDIKDSILSNTTISKFND